MSTVTHSDRHDRLYQRAGYAYAGMVSANMAASLGKIRRGYELRVDEEESFSNFAEVLKQHEALEEMLFSKQIGNNLPKDELIRQVVSIHTNDEAILENLHMLFRRVTKQFNIMLTTSGENFYEN